MLLVFITYPLFLRAWTTAIPLFNFRLKIIRIFALFDNPFLYMERLAFPIKMFTIYLEQYFLDITRLNNDLAKIKYISLIHFTGLNYAKIAKNDVQWLFFKPFLKFN